MQTNEINLFRMIFVYGLLLIPLVIFFKFKIKLVKKLLVSTVRMTLQLFLVGLYLGYIFELNNVYVNILWLLIMLIIANRHILKSSNLKIKPLLSVTIFSTLIGLLSVLLPFVLLVIKPTPLYDARYIIPVGGMILGNFLSVNIVSFNTYISSLKENRQELESYLCMGATLSEATKPYLRIAIEKALIPTVTTIATLGLVSLPGMMTGQLLGGSFPMTAIKYQIAIMVAILVAATISVTLNLVLATGRIFDKRGNMMAVERGA